MFRLEQVTPESGDGTRKYYVHLDKEYTVYSFVSTVLSISKEWGNVRLKCNDEVLNEPMIKYRCGEIQSSNISSDLLKSNIIGAVCYGGYTRADYILELPDI